MATVTQVIAATTASDASVTFDLDAGEQAVYSSFGLTKTDRVVVEVVNDGSTYQPMTVLSSNGQKVTVQMDKSSSTVSISGPIKGRLNKPLTIGSVQIVRYS